MLSFTVNGAEQKIQGEHNTSPLNATDINGLKAYYTRMSADCNYLFGEQYKVIVTRFIPYTFSTILFHYEQ